MQPKPKGREGGQAGLRMPSAHMRPVHDSAISAGQRPWRKAFVHADRCALCEQNNVPANMHVGSSNLETQPSCSHTRRCAQAPPFLPPPAHRRGHRNNCTNTNRLGPCTAFDHLCCDPWTCLTPTRWSPAAVWVLDGRLSSAFPHDYTHYPVTAAESILAVVSCCVLTRCEKTPRVHVVKSGQGGWRESASLKPELASSPCSHGWHPAGTLM